MARVSCRAGWKVETSRHNLHPPIWTRKQAVRTRTGSDPMTTSVKSVALFAKRPEAGDVKTRLSPALPAPLAAALYRGMVLDALDAIAGVADAERWVYWAEAGDAAIDAPPGIGIRTQSGGDLGDRLALAFDAMCARGPAIVIGADAPRLGRDVIDAAFNALAGADLVLAPARDGGYSLIGLARPAPQ